MGRDSPGGVASTRQEIERTGLTVLLDTNVVIRHLTGDPPEMARRATQFLAANADLVLIDVVLAECVYVLQSVDCTTVGTVGFVSRAPVRPHLMTVPGKA